MSAAKAAPPLTLATARIVHAQGEPEEETTRVISGESVARALHVASQHADNFDEIGMDLQVIAALVGKLGDDEHRAAHFLDPALLAVARRVEAGGVAPAAKYRIEAAETTR